MAERILFELEVAGQDRSASQFRAFQQQVAATGQAAQRTAPALNAAGQAAQRSGQAARGGAMSWTEFKSQIDLVVGGLQRAYGAFSAVAQEISRRQGVMRQFSGDISQARERVNGLVSELDLMRASNQLAARGIQASGRDLANVVVAAYNRAQATGREFDQVLEQQIERLSGANSLTQAFGELNAEVGNLEASAPAATGVLDRLTNTLDDTTTALMDAVEQSGELQRTFDLMFESIGGGSDTFDRAMSRIRLSGVAMAAVLVEALSRVQANFSALMAVMTAIQNGDMQGALQAAMRWGSQQMGDFRDLLSGQFGEDVNARTRDMFAARDTRDEQRRNANRVTRDRRMGRGGGNRQRQPTLEQLMGGTAGQGLFDELSGEGALGGKVGPEEDTERLKMHERELELLDQKREKTEELADAYRRASEEAMAFSGPIVSGLTSALSKVIAGTESADKAFMGMLSSFLEMIAQQSALKAAQEFAESIASFARYDYAGGAQHLAAGAAFTAVAVAAGVGAIAVAPPSGAGNPAQPETSGSGDREAGTTNIYWNAPLMVAANEAELGRQISRLSSRGNSRHASTV